MDRRGLRGPVVVVENGYVGAKGSGGCGGCGSGAGGGIFDDPDSVRFCSDEFGDGVGERGVGIDVEDWVGIFAVIHAAVGQDDGDEVDAGVFKEGGRAGAGEKLFDLLVSQKSPVTICDSGIYLYINIRDIANNVPMIVDHR